MFIGYFPVDGTLLLPLMTKNGSYVITAPDSAPTFRIYGPDAALMTNGTGTLSTIQSGTITGASDAGGPILITDVDHGLQHGEKILVADVGGTTEANGTWAIKYVNANSFQLIGSTYANAYTSGGTWVQVGLYYGTKTLSSADGYTAGEYYTAYVKHIISSTSYAVGYVFGVI